MLHCCRAALHLLLYAPVSLEHNMLLLLLLVVALVHWRCHLSLLLGGLSGSNSKAACCTAVRPLLARGPRPKAAASS